MAKIITDKKIIDEILTRGVENIYPTPEFLRNLLSSGKKLTLYLGIDPTGKLHIGHSIPLRKLRQFQDLGHEVIVLIGDFTAQIGDPTDKTATRKKLTRQQVLANAKDYKKLIGKILDLTKLNIRFLHNEEWTNKLKPVDMLELASHFTVQQLLERDMFQERIKQGKEIYLHEFLYPMFQAYDSVTMNVDGEIGGNDQMFNMLAGRTLMKKIKNKEKFVLTTKLLEDPTGKKMGKTEGNMIALTDQPQEIYGKIMSWPDSMILVGFEILTDAPTAELPTLKKRLVKENPRDLKMELAKEVVKVYWGEKAAIGAQAEFQKIFQQKQLPTEIKKVLINDKDGRIGVLDLFVQAGLAKSNSEVRRLINEGAIKIDRERVVNIGEVVKIPKEGLLLQKGKKDFVRAMRK